MSFYQNNKTGDLFRENNIFYILRQQIVATYFKQF